ncbi:hypothetical protein JCGZ_10588 [Jatropha curcas]|uniref:Uncharacterized protein n=1 Tax=Jatropha curcas TaxID=180498 RepID=A0A067KIJ4_JATCU|nr:hypothetical protein JCGZ_10588 [Jatropha curcas]
MDTVIQPPLPSLPPIPPSTQAPTSNAAKPSTVIDAASSASIPPPVEGAAQPKLKIVKGRVTFIDRRAKLLRDNYTTRKERATASQAYTCEQPRSMSSNFISRLQEEQQLMEMYARDRPTVPLAPSTLIDHSDPPASSILPASQSPIIDLADLIP